MKYLIIASVVLLFMCSCKKEKDLNTTSYIGTWELTKTYSNGIIYVADNYSKGNGNTVTFTNDGAFIKKVKGINGSSTNEYGYRLENGKFCGHDEPIDTFLYYGDKNVQLLRLQNGTLLLESTICVDAGMSATGESYRKIR